jgi:putative sugar O-methyltransferase
MQATDIPLTSTVTALPMEERHKRYRQAASASSKTIGRSNFWEQLSKEFSTDYSNGRFRPVGRRAIAYAPIFDPASNDSIARKMAHTLSRSMRKVARRFQSFDRLEYRWQDAYTDLKLHQTDTPFNAFNHPLLGSAKVRLTPDIFRMHYFFGRLYPYLRSHPSPQILEIGAGAGMLGALFHHDLKAKYVIIDLPETMELSSGLIATLFPKASLMLPNEIPSGTESLPREMSADFTFLWPNQSHLLADDSFDAAVNTSSFMEMKPSEIAEYFDLIQRTVKHDGYFYCCNRMEKQPGLGDVEMRSFFAYPWNPSNKDVLLNEAKLVRRAGGHLHMDRIQQIQKHS